MLIWNIKASRVIVYPSLPDYLFPSFCVCSAVCAECGWSVWSVVILHFLGSKQREWKRWWQWRSQLQLRQWWWRWWEEGVGAWQRLGRARKHCREHWTLHVEETAEPIALPFSPTASASLPTPSKLMLPMPSTAFTSGTLELLTPASSMALPPLPKQIPVRALRTIPCHL